jgi:hypothetical protein
VYADWPALLGFAAPVGVGALVGFLSRSADAEAWLGIFIAMFLCVLPLGAAASYWLSCRVMDRSGQPWAFISFFVSLACWFAGIGLYLGISDAFGNK